jgi:hypothetical protein
MGVTAIYRPEQLVRREGPESLFHRADGATTFHFCPRCGSTLWFQPDDPNDAVIGISAGAFADPQFPSPIRVMHARHAHPFMKFADGPVVHLDAPPEAL